MIKACAENESELNRVCNNDMKECLIWLLPEVGFQILKIFYAKNFMSDKIMASLLMIEIENQCFQASDSTNLSSI